MMFISQDEVAELTGYQQPKRQAKWLADNGYRFALDAAGRPKALRSEIERRLGKTEKTTGKRPRLELLKKIG